MGHKGDDIVEIPTPDGPMAAIVARPAGAGPVPAAIMYPHIGGLTETMRMMARRAAQGGYCCVVPDLYHRLGTIVLDPQSANPDVLAIMRVASASVTRPNVLADTRSVLDALDQDRRIAPGRRGTIGYGAGGGFAVLAAGTYPDRIGAAASVLGRGFVVDAEDSPHRVLGRIRGEVYGAFAEIDEIIPASVPEELGAELRASNVAHELVIHLRARHPYAFPDRAIYDRAAAERDWTAIFAMFSRCLRGS